MRERQNRKRMVALGEIPAELVLKNGRVVNLFSGRIFTADVAVEGGIIAGVGSYRGEKMCIRDRFQTAKPPDGAFPSGGFRFYTRPFIIFRTS